MNRRNIRVYFSRPSRNKVLSEIDTMYGGENKKSVKRFNISILNIFNIR